jgi:uncharacterized protein
LLMGHVHPVVVFRDPAGFKLTKPVWMKAKVDAEILAQTLLTKHNVKVEGSIAETLKKHYGIKSATEQVVIMPSFNDFLGGRPVNEMQNRKGEGAEELVGPVLRLKALDLDETELYLLDGTYLGTLTYLRNL